MKKYPLLLTTLLMSLLMSITAFAGDWKQDDKGWWYEKDDGSYIVNDWFIDPDTERTYHFDTFGYMNTGVTYLGGKWYHFNEDDGSLMYNYAPSDNMISTDDGTMVTADTPGITIKAAAFYNDDKDGVYLAIENLRNVPVTIQPLCEISDKDFRAEVYLLDTEAREYCVEMILEPKETKTFVYTQPDFRPLNMKSGETTAKFHFECEDVEYWMVNEIWSFEEMEFGYITHIDP